MRLGWAKLLKRVFNLDLEHCPNCGDELKVIAAIREVNSGTPPWQTRDREDSHAHGP
jgi:hypothetical protein